MTSDHHSPKFAWVTLLTRPSYLPGVITLASTTLIAARFEDTWTKLRAFQLTSYQTCVFLDADITIYKNMDEIFELELPADDWIAANQTCVCNLDHDSWAPKKWTRENCPYTPLQHPAALEKATLIPLGAAPPDTYALLNGGVFLYHPSEVLWKVMHDHFLTSPELSTFQFPDQDFLASLFCSRWRPLPWKYNALKTWRQWHTNIWRDEGVKGLHYIVDKPWEKRVASDGIGGYLGRDGETHTWWWNVWREWRSQRENELLSILDELVAIPLGEEADKRQCEENKNKGFPIPIPLGSKDANGIGRPATYAAQLLFSLFVTNSALPTTSHVPEQTTNFPINATLGLDNETLIRPPSGIPWSPDISTSQASVLYPIPNTAITLNFTHFGSKIPVVRALSTIYDARQQVQSHLAPSSEDATKKAPFVYSTRSTPPATRICFVVVQAYGGPGLSWLQLDQILEGLTQFTSGAGIDHQVHYQALEFGVNLTDERRIGVGLLWCTPARGRGAAEVEKRAETPIAGQELDERANLVSGLTNETSLNLSNESILLSNPTAEVSFPVPGTNISLAFVWLGNPIPSKMVNEALRGAVLKISPFLHKSGSEQIPHNRFFYWTPAGKVRVAIQIYGTIHLSWSQVNSVIAGLFRFTNGIGTIYEQAHFENLGFDVRDENGGTIGYGNLLATPVYGIDTVNEKPSPRTSPPINSTHLQLPPPTPPEPRPWPIPNTTLTLLFTYMGAALPADEVNAAIGSARHRVAPAILTVPDSPIAADGFETHVGTVQVSVAPYQGCSVSWAQLGQVLTGLEGFCRPLH
ncbi:MAG: hypothetical protein Q9161_008655, partial [Pseudevernia consocians]